MRSGTRYVPRPRSSSGWGVVILIVAVLVLIIGWTIFSATHVTQHVGCKVTDKDRTTHGNSNSSDMRIYTSNCGVFQVRDSLLSWTFHSSDTYGSIQRGHTYDFKTRGFRIPFTSSFPNIVGVTEVPNGQ